MESSITEWMVRILSISQLHLNEEEVCVARAEALRGGRWVQPPLGSQAPPYVATTLPVVQNQPFTPQHKAGPNPAIHLGGYQGIQTMTYQGGQ